MTKVIPGSCVITEQGDLGLGVMPISETVNSSSEEEKKKKSEDGNKDLY